MMTENIEKPNREWYEARSKEEKLANERCPYADKYKCPRYWKSLDLLDASSVNKNQNEHVQKFWEKTAPSLLEEYHPPQIELTPLTLINGKKARSYSNMCPEATYIGLDNNIFFEKIKYTINDEESLYEKSTGKKDYLSDRRYQWDVGVLSIKPMHYSDCPLFPVLNQIEVEINENNGFIDESEFKHSPDFTWISFRDKNFTLTSRQAEFVQFFYEQHKNGISMLRFDHVATELNITSDTIRDLFQSRIEAYKTLFESPEKGFYRLKISFS